jgi:hypothetical protein
MCTIFHIINFLKGSLCAELKILLCIMAETRKARAMTLKHDFLASDWQKYIRLLDKIN